MNNELSANSFSLFFYFEYLKRDKHMRYIFFSKLHHRIIKNSHLSKFRIFIHCYLFSTNVILAFPKKTSQTFLKLLHLW